MILEAPPRKVLIGISGFLETQNRTSGVEDILWQVFTDVDSTYTARYMWNDSLVTMARYCRRMLARWPVQLNVLGYSYGGQTAVRLAGDVPVSNLFLIDPVWRPFDRWPSFLSIGGIGSLRVPDTVGACYVWRQRVSLIRGCEVLLQGKQTTLYEDELNFRHTRIDNSVQVKGAILEAMKA